MYKFLLSVLLIASFTTIQAQDKKVAVVTFYADRRVDLKEFGLEQGAQMIKLSENADFNLGPILNYFHQQFFEVYSKNFPFQLVPEQEVLDNPDYKSFVPEERPTVYTKLA